MVLQSAKECTAKLVVKDSWDLGSSVPQLYTLGAWHVIEAAILSGGT